MEGHLLRFGWTIPSRLLLTIPLALLTTCREGSSPPPQATRIVYTPPTTGAYQLVLNAEKSTNTHLVLDLLGPTGTAGRGVAFHLATDQSRMKWSKVNSGDTEFAQSAAFRYGSVLKTKVASDSLQVGAFLTWAFAPSVTFDRTVVLATVALDLVPGSPTGTATLRSDNGSAVMLPALQGADPVTITITTGTVTLQ